MSELKIITEPKVYLVSRQEINPDGLDHFLLEAKATDWTTDADSAADGLSELGGRVCYMSFSSPRPGGNAAYLQHIKDVGHSSVFEHAVFGLIVTGISRACSHELVRHRVGISPSQLSQRYVDSSDVAFVVPPLLLGLSSDDAYLLDGWKRQCKLAKDAYSEQSDDFEKLILVEQYREAGGKCDEPEYENHYEMEEIDYALAWVAKLPAKKAKELETPRRKQAREAARSVLPNATETKIMLTGNARAWRHFVELRASEHADAEIRRLAVAVLRVLQSEAPGLFGDYTITALPEGGEVADTPYRKI